MCQCTHVQNHAYTNKNRCMYVCDICQLSNPVDNTIHLFISAVAIKIQNKENKETNLKTKKLCFYLPFSHLKTSRKKLPGWIFKC